MNNKTQTISDYSVIGKKIFLGFSGLVLLGFIVGHLAGNLSVFAGADAINSYAHFLHNSKVLLYFARFFLLFMLITHIYFSFSLTFANKAAREKDYACKQNLSATLASRTMIYSGLIILFFLIFHLLHFTLGKVQPDFYGILDEKNRIDVYYMLIKGFSSSPLISFIYITALSCLGLHLSHAFFSVCQTFSIINTRETIHKARKMSTIVSVIIILGYMSIPLTIFMKIISI
jgi:succinate dehydrogenase / fumarate reductase cytochrome b subunit